jgi:preprotein translocase subunit SecG
MATLVRLVLGSMLVLTSLFMILLVLVQRGRGGGLAGALGGMGGQSAFGTKAGDLFTRITVGVAAFWIVLCIVATNMLGRQQSLLSSDLGGSAPQAVAPMTPTQPMTQPPAEAQPPAAADGGLVMPAAPADQSSSQPSSQPAAEAKSEGTAAPAAPSAPAAPAEPAPAK